MSCLPPPSIFLRMASRVTAHMHCASACREGCPPWSTYTWKRGGCQPNCKLAQPALTENLPRLHTTGNRTVAGLNWLMAILSQPARNPNPALLPSHSCLPTRKYALLLTGGTVLRTLLHFCGQRVHTYNNMKQTMRQYQTGCGGARKYAGRSNATARTHQP